jgi:hypothetical protein
LLVSKAGFYSLAIKGRANSSATAGQDLPLTSLQSGNTYNLSMPVFSLSSGTAQAVLTVVSTGGGTQTFSTPPVSTTFGFWGTPSGTVQPTWTGTLTKATVSVLFSGTADFWVDQVSFTDVTYPKNSSIIDRVVLSPTSNPYGTPNASGIYVINCAGKQIAIGNSRIAGTLVLIGQSGSSIVQGPVIWEPAVANYPALLSDNSFKIGFDATPLNEGDLNLNFNPTGVPYPYNGGVSNATTGDSYPAAINGMIYCGNDLTLMNAPSLNGITIADHNIAVTATPVNLKYNSIYLNNPPPGFVAGTVTMKVTPGSWKRIVD